MCMCGLQGPIKVLVTRMQRASASGPHRLGPSLAEHQAVALAHINCLAGACLALGLKFAGSANADAHATLCGCLQELLALKQQVRWGSKGGAVAGFWNGPSSYTEGAGDHLCSPTCQP
jgi:anaphase-promoting complex subunit 1